MLTSRTFFETIVVPNNVAQHDDTSSLRHAFNAIASLDDYVGILAYELLSAGKTPHTEEAFRDELAGRSEPYRILRDMAFALKHGELKHNKARLVKRAGGLSKQEAAFEPGAFSDAFQTKELICVELDCGRAFSVWQLIENAMSAITDLENDLVHQQRSG